MTGGGDSARAYQLFAESLDFEGEQREQFLTRECGADLEFRAEVDALLQSVDALALPTLPDVPLALASAGDAAAAIRTTRFVRPFNVSGHPALTLPLQTSAGLPAGLQLVGPWGADAALCSMGRRIVG